MYYKVLNSTLIIFYIKVRLCDRMFSPSLDEVKKIAKNKEYFTIKYSFCNIYNI